MQNYSFLQKQLHHLVLGNKLIKKSLFEIEKIFFVKQLADIRNQHHVFITGLPRSGTTILLEFLYQGKEFASLTYRDMPFVLAPNLFCKISKKGNIKSQERIHQDGIHFDLNSPEAFDDIFFQTFTDEEIKDNLEIFISLVLQRYRKQRYLSKNNNNYKRIKLIHSVFPNALIFITYRDPIQHAYSLLKQHRRFCEIQKKNKFVLKYMNFLGHNEFGLNYKSWHLPEEYNDPFTLNHWLEQWHLFYQNIITDITKNKNVILISYEKLCNNTELTKNLVLKLNLNQNEYKNYFKLSQQNVKERCDEHLLMKCNKSQDLLNRIGL